jgi:hypothetical protein
MSEKRELVQVIAEMMNCFDFACDRIRDVDEILDLDEEEKVALENHGEELKSVILDIKTYFRNLQALDAKTKEELEPYLR